MLSEKKKTLREQEHVKTKKQSAKIFTVTKQGEGEYDQVKEERQWGKARNVNETERARFG